MSTSATPSSNPMPGSTAEAAPALSEGQRLMNVFIAPSKTFCDLRRKANWFVPWLVLAVASLGFIGAAAQKIGFRQIAENAMRMNPKAQERMAQLPPERREAAVDVAVTFTKVFSFASPAIALLVYLIMAAILMGTFNFGLGAEVPFGTSLAIVTYAQLPGIIKLLLIVVSLFAGADPEGFNIDNPVASNLGYFVDAVAHPALYRLASGFDVFNIWIIVLTGIGFACVSKVRRSTAIGVVLAWYGFYILVLKVGPALIFG